MSPTARTRTILGRFPRHLEVDAPGKLFADVVDELGLELDVKSRQLARVRRSHALGDADQERDLRLLGGLHGFRDEDFDILRLRLDAAGAVRATLVDPSSTPADRSAASAKLLDLLGLRDDAFPEWPGEADAGPAQARLAAALATLVSYRSRLEALRGSLRSVIELGRIANGTITALLGAAAAYLTLEPAAVTDAEDGYWHVATGHDLLRLTRPEPPGSRPATTVAVPQADLLALEENPLRQQDSDPIDRRHGDWFQMLRSGFEAVPTTVRVIGVQDRTVWPMVVNVDAGFGVVFTGSVPDGRELRFESDGRVTLAGASVARLCVSFSGGVFADAAKANALHDFVFAGDSVSRPVATFAVTAPVADGFDPATQFPHSEGLLEPAQLPVGPSRWAFFVRSGSYGRTADTPADELAIPVFNAAAFDGSVFQPDTSTGAPSSGKIGFSWLEHEPFAVRLWIPRRFSALDAPGEVPVAERLRLTLDRHRAAGIHVYVQYADDRWTLPGGIIRDVGSDEPLGTVVSGTALWSAQP